MTNKDLDAVFLSEHLLEVYMQIASGHQRITRSGWMGGTLKLLMISAFESRHPFPASLMRAMAWLVEVFLGRRLLMLVMELLWGGELY